MNFLIEKNNKLILRCYISPNSAKTHIKGEREQALWIALNAPPIDGKANKELINFLSKLLKIPKTHIIIQKGTQSRYKTVQLLNTNLSYIQKILDQR